MFYFGTDVRVVARDVAIRECECEWCRIRFEYWKDITSVGTGHAPFMIGRGALADDCERRARRSLARQIDEARFAVPCPGCGLYQADMIPLVRRTKYQKLRWLRNVMWWLAPVLFFVVALSIAAPIEAIGGPLIGVGAATATTVCTALLLCLVPGFVVQQLRRMMQDEYDPNADPYEDDRRLKGGPASPHRLLRASFMDRSNHYEAAFEAFLRSRGVGFVAVDEAKRSLLGDADVKSLDFIVVGPHDARLVVDVKGRRFPGGTPDNPRKVWQNWSTRDDLDGLGRWAAHFGPDFRGVLAFSYKIEAGFALPADTPDLFEYRDATYLMRAVGADDYKTHMRPRSPRWGTVHLGVADFRRLVRPFSEFLRERTTEAQRTQREVNTEKANA